MKAALSAMTVKTDRKDARGIAQLIRMDWFRPVHCKSVGSQEVRALLVGRKLLLGKLLDVEFSIRGILRGFGLKMGMVTRRNFEARVRELCAGHSMLEQICAAGAWISPSGVEQNEPRSPWRARLAQSCIGCGSIARISAGRRRHQPLRGLLTEAGEIETSRTLQQC